jgi:hypothetical protein
LLVLDEFSALASGVDSAINLAERIYADLSAEGAPVSAGQLAAAAGLSASYARALVAQFQAQPSGALQRNGRRPVPVDADPEVTP